MSRSPVGEPFQDLVIGVSNLGFQFIAKVSSVSILHSLYNHVSNEEMEVEVRHVDHLLIGE